MFINGQLDKVDKEVVAYMNNKIVFSYYKKM